MAARSDMIFGSSPITAVRTTEKPASRGTRAFFVRQACHTFRRCKSSAGRGDRNRPSKQRCPSRGGIRRKLMTTTRTRRTGTGYKAAAFWATQQWLGKPHHHREVAKVDPARPERRTCDLPWEICPFAGQAIASATTRDERAEVSRGRSSRRQANAEGRFP
jgi:hypothetical protein